MKQIKNKCLFNKTFLISSCLCVLFLAFIIIFSTIIKDNYKGNVINDKNEVVSLNKNWRINNGSYSYYENLPKSLKYTKNKTYTLTKDLDELFLADDNKLVVQTDFSEFLVYIDDKCIFYSMQSSFDKYLNEARLKVYTIDLPKNYQNKELKIVLKMKGNDSLDYSVSNVYIGEKTLVYKNIMLGEKFKLITMAFLIVYLILLVFCSFIALRYKLNNVSNLFCLATFSLLTFIFLFSQSNLCTFLFDNDWFVNSLTYISLMLISLPILVICINKVKYSLCRALYLGAYLLIGNFLVQIVLNHLQIYDFRKMKLITFAIIVLQVFLVLRSIVKFIYENKKESTEFLYHILPMCLGAVVDMILDVSKAFYDDYFLFECGILIFIGLESIQIARTYSKYYTLSIKSEVYRSIAFTDIMTNTGNRSAYENKLKEINNNIDKYGSIWCISIDANNLKKVNDNLGHSFGDELIKGLALVLRRAFINSGECYRIGGDEFIVMIYNVSSERVRMLLDRLKMELLRYNEKSKVKLSIAIGLDSYDEYNDKNIEEVIKRADKNMYEDKSKKKLYG